MAQQVHGTDDAVGPQRGELLSSCSSCPPHHRVYDPSQSSFDELLLRITRVAMTTANGRRSRKHEPDGQEGVVLLSETSPPPGSTTTTPPFPPGIGLLSSSSSRTAAAQGNTIRSTYQALGNFFSAAAAYKKRQEDFSMKEWELRILSRWALEEFMRAAAGIRRPMRTTDLLRPSHSGEGNTERRAPGRSLPPPSPSRGAATSSRSTHTHSNHTHTRSNHTRSNHTHSNHTHTRSNHTRSNHTRSNHTHTHTRDKPFYCCVGAFIAGSPAMSLSSLRAALREEQQKEVQRNRMNSSSSSSFLILESPPPLSRCFAELLALSQVLEKRMRDAVTRAAASEDEKKKGESDDDESEEAERANRRPSGGGVQTNVSASSPPLICPSCLLEERGKREGIFSVHPPQSTAVGTVRLITFFAVAITLWPAIYLSDILVDVLNEWKIQELERDGKREERRQEVEGKKLEQDVKNEEEGEGSVRGEVALVCTAALLWCWSLLDTERSVVLRQASRRALRQYQLQQEKSSSSSSFSSSVDQIIQEVVMAVPHRGPAGRCRVPHPSHSHHPNNPNDDENKEEEEECGHLPYLYADPHYAGEKGPTSPHSAPPSPSSHSSILVKGEGEIVNAPHHHHLASSSFSVSSSSVVSLSPENEETTIDYEFWGALASTPPLRSSPGLSRSERISF